MWKPSTAEVKFRGDIAWITIASHNGMNPLSRPTCEALLKAGNAAMDNPHVRLVILTGAGERSFIAGKDLNEIGADDYKDTTAAFLSISHTHMVCHMFRAMPVPSIARINGYCLGAGMEIAACCDLRVGADHSRYGMPEVQLGSISHMEASVFPSLIGWGNTRELLYRGTMIDAETALAWGFLQRKAPLAGLDAVMEPIVEDILRAEPNAIRAQKRLIERWLDDTGVVTGAQAGLDAKMALQRLGHSVDAAGAYFQRLHDRKGKGKEKA
ncbi:MAG: enoyl-CoA hydratase/isomerase family protein [Candidatus Lambdaproteobacteria bacterium]|nr:enoyl-CoA hydratase/isomerase family protein [Candidatus Lambdaproteobacteria bacterium]